MNKSTPPQPPSVPIPSSAVQHTTPPAAPSVSPPPLPKQDPPKAEIKTDSKPTTEPAQADTTVVQNRLRTLYILNVDHRPECDAAKVSDPDETFDTDEEAEAAKKKAEPKAKQPDDFCLCTVTTMQVAAVTPDGEMGVRVLNRVLPGSITWLAGEKKSVPAWVIETEAFKAALAAKALRVVPSEAKKAPAEPTP